MTKKDIIADIAKREELNKNVVTNVINAFLNDVADAVVDGEVVSVVPLGKFYAKDTPARRGHNLGTGEIMNIPASAKVVFKPCTGFKDAVKAESRRGVKYGD